MAFITDLSSGLGALVKVATEVRNRNLTFTDATTFANDLQAILVDIGIEPPAVEDLIDVAEVLIPALKGLYETGVITGGYRPLENNF